MPEVGARTWKLFYAAKAGNWENAIWQWKETKGLFELAGFVRPKHEDALNEYMEKDWSKLEAPLKARDFAAFEKAFHEAIVSANAWHDQKDKPFIKWKLPDFPPPDLDFTPRGKVGKRRRTGTARRIADPASQRRCDRIAAIRYELHGRYSAWRCP